MTRPTLAPSGWRTLKGGAFPTFCPQDNVIKAILVYAGFLLIIILFTEEFARALAWLRAGRKRSRRRLMVYPLLVLLMVAAGIIIAASLIEFITTLTFSYD